jgi:hypothetical protein
MNKPPKPEFSRILEVDTMPKKGHEETIEATAVECAALAKRFSLHTLTALSADLVVHAEAGSLIRLRGEVTAAYTQLCVVTLEPMEMHQKWSFLVTFAPAETMTKGAGDALITDFDAEDIEPYTHGQIDLGEQVAQSFVEKIDSYPRKEGATFAFKDSENPKDNNPFSRLRVEIGGKMQIGSKTDEKKS